MRRDGLFILYILVGLLPLKAADPVELCGVIKDAETGDPVAGAIVKTKGAFTSTDREGKFILKLKASADSVSFKSMGYESVTLPVTAEMSDVRMRQKATQLNDVIVEAPDIYARGDTLVFNVSRYANAKDDAIIDVIKRLPGIKVREDGTIEYQGKPINKFYIDGTDFIGGQYTLATNNISYKDVKSVEVMENHQPVKALEGIEFPEEAGINLKLKEDARSRWVGVAKASAGVQPLLLDGSVYTMRMARKVQNMLTLKADNTGWNPAHEIKEHDFDDMFSWEYNTSSWPEYISADIVNAPLSERRTRDNLSWLANAITAWRHGDTSMRLKLNYMADRLDFNSGLTTVYPESGIPTFRQNNSQRTQNHDLSAQFNSETNKRGYYLKDKLTLTGIWNSSNSAITGSFNLNQHVGRKNFSAVNDLKLVKRNEKKLFTLTSRNSFSHSPDHLLVEGLENAQENLGISDFRSTTETRFGKFTRFWKFYMTTGMDVNFHRMSSELSGMGIFDNKVGCNAFLSNLYATPQADYERSGWRLSFRLPLKWNHYSINGQHDYVNLSPGFSARHQLTSKSEVSGNIYYSLESPRAYLYVKTPILSDYRNLFIADNTERYTHNANSSVSYRYRNPLKSLFINISASYNFRKSWMMSNQLFVDDFIINTFSDKISDSNTWQLKGGASKGLGHSRMVVGIDASTSESSASSMRDNETIPYRQISAGIKPYFKGSIINWLSVNYEAEYSFSRLIIKEEDNSYHTLHHDIFASFIPNDFVQFTVGAEHFMTRFPERNYGHLILLDASAVWNVNNKVRLSLTANNLLNKRTYEYATYGILSRSEHVFRIRPRAILASLQYRF